MGKLTKPSKFKNPLGTWSEITGEFSRISWGGLNELRYLVRTIFISIVLWGLATYVVDLTLQNALYILRSSLLRYF